jgi:hypothetical protein
MDIRGHCRRGVDGLRAKGSAAVECQETELAGDAAAAARRPADDVLVLGRNDAERRLCADAHGASQTDRQTD